MAHLARPSPGQPERGECHLGVFLVGVRDEGGGHLVRNGDDHATRESSERVQAGFSFTTLLVYEMRKA